MTPISEVPELKRMLQEAQQARFWGTVELTFQDGELTMRRTVQTVKIDPQEKNRIYGTRPTPPR
jgi:hypothetical protein